MSNTQYHTILYDTAFMNNIIRLDPDKARNPQCIRISVLPTSEVHIRSSPAHTPTRCCSIIVGYTYNSTRSQRPAILGVRHSIENEDFRTIM